MTWETFAAQLTTDIFGQGVGLGGGVPNNQSGSFVAPPIHVAPVAVNLGAILQQYQQPITNGGFGLELPSRLAPIPKDVGATAELNSWLEYTSQASKPVVNSPPSDIGIYVLLGVAGVAAIVLLT